MSYGLVCLMQIVTRGVHAHATPNHNENTVLCNLYAEMC